ncbi:hypothetical protein HYY75_04475, partial [bacterium]|nr:hypothetical protein [bacterium]
LGKMAKEGGAFRPKIQVDGQTKESDDFYVIGKGMIVVSGNIYLNCNIKVVDYENAETETKERTVFTLMARKGGLVICNTQMPSFCTLEGSLYTDKGIFIKRGASLHIFGNWVTNLFNKPSMAGTVVIDYVSSRVRNSLGSIHPERGKLDPRRYHVSLSPTWASWRAY